MPDEDGYPTTEELERIQRWPAADFWGLMRYVIGLWWHRKSASSEGLRACQLHTCGWSGNEDIIGAMQSNSQWWTLHWWSSRRGGHYEFCELGRRD